MKLTAFISYLSADASDEGDFTPSVLKLVKSIRGESKYPDQDAVHRQHAEYFCQLAKYDSERFANDYDWYVQKGLIK